MSTGSWNPLQKQYNSDAAKERHPYSTQPSTPCPEPCINVAAYGAVGDGVTINTAAIQNALNAAG